MKNGYFWHKTAQIWEGTSDLAPMPWAATDELLAQNSDLARAPPRLEDDYIGERSQALGQSNGQNSMETFLLSFLLLLLPLLAKIKRRGALHSAIFVRSPDANFSDNPQPEALKTSNSNL